MKHQQLLRLVSIITLVMIILASACNKNYTPRPPGYFRITLPEKAYQRYNSTCPYSFDYPVYAQVHPDSSEGAEPCWANVDFPEFKGHIHLSYKPVQNNNVYQYMEDARTLAYKHTVMADAINEQVFVNHENNVYGILYDIQGNAASSLQFSLTDSSRHFVRGALYFDVVPNKDSIKPVLEFVQKDIIRMIESFEWKNTTAEVEEE